MPILTVTLNAAIDKLYTVPGFTVDHVHRPAEMRVFAGGKGINVARVYRLLGGDVTATGFLGGSNGEQIRQNMQQEGISGDFVGVAHESRVCIAIIDPEAGTQTELNENGPMVTVNDCDALLSRLRELLPGRDAVVISGSIPPGAPPKIYRDILHLAQDEFGVKAVLDASGDALKLAASAQPYMLKPNQHELAALEVAGDGWSGSATMLREKYGLTLAMITAGPRGAVVASGEGVWEASPPSIQCISAVGSGDSLAAAFLWALERGWAVPDALKLGVAAGAANATTYGSGFCSREQIFALYADVTVKGVTV